MNHSIGTAGFRRRTLLGASAALAWPAASFADTAPYPARPVTILVPYSPGGATDAVARVAATYLGIMTKGVFVIENKPGASGTISMAQVAKSAPDGLTLMLMEITSTVVGVLVPRLTFDPAKAFTPVAMIAETPFVLVVNEKLPVKTLQEFVAYARANPGKLNYGSGGVGSGPHIAGELFKSVAKVDIKHVPYKGSGPALQDLMGGQIDMLITAAPTVSAMNSKVRALAVARASRLSILPDVPSAVEVGMPEFQISNWFGLATPRGTPASTVQWLSDAVAALLKNREAVDKLVAAGADPLPMGPTEFQARVTRETARWSALIARTGIKNDN